MKGVVMMVRRAEFSTASSLSQVASLVGLPDPGESTTMTDQKEDTPIDSISFSEETVAYNGHFHGSLPAVDGADPRNGRSHYHGSPDEERLQRALRKEKSTGRRESIAQARRRLHRYWRQCIKDEYETVAPAGMGENLQKIRNLIRKDSANPFVSFRLHALAARARELRNRKILDRIENIRHGDLHGSSATGLRLAAFAEVHATGYGGECYKYVAEDLDTIGVHLTGSSAYMAAAQLARNKKVREIRGIRGEQLKSLPAGAIVVWDRSGEHPHGHISIAIGGEKEASDLTRGQIKDYGTPFRVFVPSDM
jgi:hypothetical protein